MTERLYLSDPYLKRFQARVLQSFPFKGQLAVVLDRTAFYPEGGGQPGDRGSLRDSSRPADTLGAIRVLGTQEQDGEVLHLVDPNSILGGDVEGEVDWPRRFDHMQQHHGQHLLSAAFLRVHGAGTQSFHLGEQTCTVDLDCSVDRLNAEALRAAEASANQSVWGNHPVIARDFVGEERARLPLRKEPVKGDRVVLVEGVDASPCGGTHPRRTGEVGCIAILRAQRWGARSSRVEFICGNRVVRALGQATEAISRTAEVLRAAPAEVFEAAGRVTAEAQARRKRIEALEAELAAHRAEQLIASNSSGPIAQAVEGDLQAAKVLGAALVARGRVALIAAREGGRAHLYFARPPGPGSPMNAVLKEVLPIVGGKGGGSAENAQGSGDASRINEALQAAVAQARSGQS